MKQNTKFIFKKGYTLVEMLVSIAVFSVVISIAVGSFTRALKTHRQSAAIISANNNAAIILEQIVRELRTSDPLSLFFNNNSSCQTSLRACQLEFLSASGKNIVYELDNGSVRKTTDGVSFIITDEDVEVVRLIFEDITSLLTPLPGGAEYPKRIRILISIKPKESGGSLPATNFQTVVSLRNPG